MQPNFWIAATNPKKNGHFDPIKAKFYTYKQIQCQGSHSEVKFQLTFHREKNQASNFGVQRIQSMADEMATNIPLVRHILTMPDQSRSPSSINLGLKDKNWKHS
jgi:hypothetical protein